MNYHPEDVSDALVRILKIEKQYRDRWGSKEPITWDATSSQAKELHAILREHHGLMDLIPRVLSRLDLVEIFSVVNGAYRDSVAERLKKRHAQLGERYDEQEERRLEEEEMYAVKKPEVQHTLEEVCTPSALQEIALLVRPPAQRTSMPSEQSPQQRGQNNTKTKSTPFPPRTHEGAADYGIPPSDDDIPF